MAVLHCLRLLDLALQKEVMFMDLLRESQASMLVSPLEQLLQGVSPQTRRADHIVNIARYVCSLHSLVLACFVFVQKNNFLVTGVLCRYLYHSNSNPETAFEAAKILRHIANYPNIQHRLVGDFTHDQVYKSLQS